MIERSEQVDFAKRDAEKKVSRERDAMAISNGAAVKPLRARNFMFSGLDMSKVVAVAPGGHRFSHPR